MNTQTTAFQQEIKASLQSLAEEMLHGNSERLQQLLKFSGRFHKYSLGNQILIAHQCPQATHVAGYQRWQGMGYQVSKGAKGIRIMAPMPYRKEKPDGTVEERITFKTVCVFDASQLTGDKPLLEFFTPLPDDEQERCLLVEQALAEEGVQVLIRQMQGTAQGYYEPNTGIIALRPGLDSHSKLLILFHEWAHRLLHPTGTEENRVKREWQAEATGYVVAQHFGIEHPFAADYLQSWQATPQELEAQLAAVMKAASHIIGALEQADITVLEQSGNSTPEEPLPVSSLSDGTIILTAEMIDGTLITEEVIGFNAFVEMALSFKRDPDVIRLTWETVKDTRIAA